MTERNKRQIEHINEPDSRRQSTPDLRGVNHMIRKRGVVFRNDSR
jgi:hypothetical protein